MNLWMWCLRRKCVLDFRGTFLSRSLVKKPTAATVDPAWIPTSFLGAAGRAT